MLDPKLQTFLQVSETGSFTRAAEQLSLTQPAVSQHVRQLEQELGVKLLRRGGGGLKLTPEGEIAVRYAKRMIALSQSLKQEILDHQRQLTHITVGLTHTGESNSVAEALARYCSENRSVKIIVVTDTIKNLYDKLRAYEIDLAVVEGPVSEPGFSSLLLDTDSLVLVVPNSHPLVRKGLVTMEELKRQRMLLRLPESGTQNLFVAHLESRGLSLEEFNVVLEVDNIATIKDLVRRGYGVSILARSACLDELKKGKLTALPVENLSMVREIHLVYQPDFSHSDILREISRMYHEAARFYR